MIATTVTAAQEIPRLVLLLALSATLWSMSTGCANRNQLQFEVVEDRVVAGGTISFTATLTGAPGDLAAVVTSDVEPDLRQGEFSVTPTVAGHHVLTARVDHRGTMYTAWAEIEVTPDVLDSVDLILDSPTIVAGLPGTFQTRAADRYGNQVTPPDSMHVTADRAELSVNGFTFASTKAGDYVLTLTADGASDSEPLAVSPAEAVSISLSLGNPNIEKNRTVLALVELRDRHGNRADGAWSLSVDGTGAVTIDGSELTFHDEGIYNITAAVDGSTLRDSLGPLIVDSSGPRIHIESPDRASWSTDFQQTIAGQVIDDWSDIAATSVQEHPVPLSDDGRFSTTVSCEPGVNLLSTTAMDTDGNASDDTRALLCGDFASYGRRGVGDGVTRGIEVRLFESGGRQGTGGLELIEDRAAAMIRADTLDDHISNPVVSEHATECLFGICVEYSVTLRVVNPAMSSASVWLDPRSNGTIRSRLRVFNPSFDWYGNASISSVGYTGNGDIRASYLEVWATLHPTLRNHVISVSVSDVSTSTVGFVFEMPPWLAQILRYFHLHDTVQAFIRSRMELAISNATRTSLPTVLRQALRDLAINETFDVQGARMSIEAVPSHLSVNTYGLTLGLETHMTAETWSLPDDHEYLGVLRADYRPPSWYYGSGARIAFSVDFLDQALFALWGGGVLTLEATDEDLGIAPDDLDDLLPGLTDLTVTLDPRLPPVATPGSDGELLQLQLGDYLLSVYDGDAQPDNLVLQAYTTVFIDMTLSVNGAMKLVPVLENSDLHFDIVYPERDWQDREGVMGLFVSALLPVLAERLEGIPLPTIDGVRFRTDRVYNAGSDDGYVTLDGVLID